jgi:hypothetical protein
MRFAVSWCAGAGIDLKALCRDPTAVLMTSGRRYRLKLLYRLPPGVAPLQTRKFKGDGIELRCGTSGGKTEQDVLPPSISPVTRKPYRWLRREDCWRQLPELPADLLAFSQRLTAPRESTGTATPTGADHADIQAMLDRIKPDALGYDDWLHVGMALHHEAEGDDVGLDLWDTWSIGGGKKYKGRAELESKWAGFSLDHEHPRTLRSLERLATTPVDMSAEFEAVPGAFEVLQIPTTVGVAPRLEPPPPHRLAFRPDVTFLSRPPLKWYIPRVLPACEITMVYGASGSGKSFFVYDLVAAIAQGHDWCGRKTKKTRVARIVAEGSAGDTQRVRAYASMNGGALPGLIECHARLDLASDDYIAIGKQIELAGGADIVVVDTLTAAAPSADQSSQKEMGMVIDHCRAIRAATGAMIFWIHHSGKDPSKGSRGSSAIPAAVDCEFEVTALPNNRQAEITKMRDGESGAIFPFVLRQVVLGTDDDGEPITSCVVDHLSADPMRQRNAAVRQPSGANQKIVWKAFQEIAGITGQATLSELCDQAVEAMTTMEGQRDTRLQRAMRAIETLATEDFLVLDGGMVRCI